ncbi:MAG: RNA-guided pseudouridylation complex pseudouridine synthase subunit Cbf5 [Candidatus Nanohaloarchaea archaeon]
MKQETWYTKEEAETDPKFGSIPEKRSIEDLLDKGFVVIDKPYGPTSNQVSYWVKEELKLKKTGHFGTLDPNATGILPIGLDSGTRINPALSKADKEYIFEIKLNHERPEEKVREILQEFKGTNKQVPPEKSAVKKQEREREVYEIELIEVEGKKVLGRVKCESGFYVRVLAEQLGEKLDTEAEMTELRRTMQGGLTEENLNTLQEVVDAYKFYTEDNNEEALREVLNPIERAVTHLRKIVVKDSAVNAVANGSNLGSSGVSKLQGNISEGETVAIVTLKGELIALGKAKTSSQKMFDSDLEAVNVNNVYMDPGIYPKRWKQ